MYRTKRINRVKFITQAVLAALPPLYSNEDKSDEETLVVAKWFTPWAGWTWYATELEPETGLAFGYVVGQESELGYFNLNELAETRGPAGLTVEPDIHWTPRPLSEVMGRAEVTQ